MYQNGGAAGGALAATGATAMNYAWLGIALFTFGFALLAVGKLLPRAKR